MENCDCCQKVCSYNIEYCRKIIQRRKVDNTKKYSYYEKHLINFSELNLIIVVILMFVKN